MDHHSNMNRHANLSSGKLRITICWVHVHQMHSQQTQARADSV